MPDRALDPAPEYRRAGDWLEVRCAGPANAAWMMGLFREVSARVEREPAEAVVIDIRGITMEVLTTTDRYRVGEEAAARWFGVPVVVVASAPLVDPDKFAEMVARSRGVDGRVFTDMDEARAWLKARLAARAGGDTRPRDAGR